MVSPNISNIYGNSLPTFSTTFALLTTKMFSADISQERREYHLIFYELQCCFSWFSVYLPEQGEGGGEVPENLFQIQGKLGSAGFHIKRAPLAWKLGKSRLPGRPKGKE